VFLENLPSAPTNTESVDGKKKIRVAKKGKKGRKGQHRGVPWPPRPLGTTSIQTEPMPAAEAAFEDTIEAPMVSCPAVVEEDTPHPPSRLEADLQQDTDRSSRLPPPSTTVAVPPSVRTSRRTQILPPGAGRTPAKDVSQKCAQRSVPHLPFNDSVSNSSEEGVVHDAEVGIQHDDEAVHEPQLHMEDGHGMVQDQQCPKVDLPHVSPEHGHQLISDTPSCLPLEQSHRPLRSDLRDDATLLNQEGPALHLPAEHKSRKRHAPRPRPGYNNVRHSQGPTDQLQTTTEVNSHVPQVDKSLARRNHQQQQVDGNLAHGQHDPYYADGNVFHEGHLQQPVDGNLAHVEHRHQQQADAVLHGISDLNGPYRIGKAQKKRRPQHQVMAPMSFRNLESVPQTEFDKALVTLSTAHHADQSRKDRDIEKEAEYSKEVKALLQAQINQLTETISEWKGKFAALNTVVIDFREKAKTNQKFVSGLQKDHEKLQKSVVTIRDECKKALREKIAELEHEKSSLLRQFDTTLASLEKGQKKAKGTIDELYVDLRISQSKRKDLEGNLTKQIAMYEEEKSKRNDLEKRLLPSVQTVQRLLDDRSTQLIKSLDALRTSLDGVAANKETDASLQECVDTLRKIQARPSLTSKDLERSEGMLRFVHNG
jgi:esterase/lipase